jgi:hypothetical protein
MSKRLGLPYRELKEAAYQVLKKADYWELKETTYQNLKATEHARWKRIARTVFGSSSLNTRR